MTLAGLDLAILGYGFVALVVLNTRGCKHDGVMLMMSCLSTCNEITNQITIWTKESLRSSCSTSNRMELHEDFMSTHSCSLKSSKTSN